VHNTHLTGDPVQGLRSGWHDGSERLWDQSDRIADFLGSWRVKLWKKTGPGG